jgi:glycosyltransferase involved in cell wall biosynthesis
MKRILFLDHTAKLSGGERSLLLILEKLNRKRFTPLLVTLEDGPLLDAARKLDIDAVSMPILRLVSERKRKGTGILFLSFSLFVLLPTIVSIVRFARKTRIDIIYTNSQKAHLIGIGVRLIARMPVFWHFRDILQERLLKRLMCYAGLLFTERIIAISHAVASQFTICGREYGKVSVVYNALDINEFERQSRDAPVDLRKEFGLGKDAKIIASVGQIAEWKGQEYLLHAAKKLVLDYDDLFFFIIGKPLFKEQSYRTRLQALVHELGLDGRIFFTGFRWDIPAVMRSIDILVHAPIHPEPFGRVLIEAMVCDTAVVAFDIGAVGEIAGENTGILVPPYDVDGLVRGITSLLEGGEGTSQMVEAAHSSAKERFDHPALMEKIEQLLEAQCRKRE